MTFADAQMTYVHLVSWPSVWLPPPGTHKLLLLGFDQQAIEHFGQALSNDFGSWSWALYYVPDFDIDNQEHVDWLIVNSHVTNVLVNSAHKDSVLMALMLKRSNTYFLESTLLVDRICEAANWRVASFAESLGHVISNQHKEGTVL